MSSSRGAPATPAKLRLGLALRVPVPHVPSAKMASGGAPWYIPAETAFHQYGDLVNFAFVTRLHTFGGLPVYVHLNALAMLRLKQSMNARIFSRRSVADEKFPRLITRRTRM